MSDESYPQPMTGAEVGGRSEILVVQCVNGWGRTICLPRELMLSELSFGLPTIDAFAANRCTSLAFVMNSHSPLRTSAN